MGEIEVTDKKKYIAGATIEAGQVCFIESDGRVYPGNSFLTAVGFALHAAQAGQLVEVGRKAEWLTMRAGVISWSPTQDSIS